MLLLWPTQCAHLLNDDECSYWGLISIRNRARMHERRLCLRFVLLRRTPKKASKAAAVGALACKADTYQPIQASNMPRFEALDKSIG